MSFFHSSERATDFADTDHKFALNSKLSFFVPEHLFHDKAFEKDCLHPLLEMNVAELPMVPVPWFHPTTHSCNQNQESSSGQSNIHIPAQQEMIVFVGPPGAGK